MIRLLLIILFLIVFFLLSIPVYLVEWVLGKINIDLRTRSSYFIVRYAFKIVLFLSGAKISVSGIENIPKDRPVLYVGNHNSFFDILTSCSVIAYPTGYVAKKEIKKVPLLNIWMYYINCIFIDRKNVREGLKTILHGIDIIKSGTSLFIFPEGTRSKTGEIAPFKPGSMKLAQKSGCPIIPVAFKNTSALFEKQFPRVKSASVSIEFGEPIMMNELPKEQQKDMANICRNKILRMLEH